MPKTRSFDPAIDKKLTCTCSHARCDKRTVSQATLDKLQLMRDDLGAPMIIRSGARCPYHVNEIGRAATDHQSCECVDIECKDQLMLVKLLVLSGRYGATRAAFSEKKGFVHVSFVRTARKDVPTWIYEDDDK